MGAIESNVLKIDGISMRRELSGLGYGLESLDEEMGFAKGYLNNTFQREKMPLRAALMLKKLTGVDAMEYLQDDKEKQDPKINGNMYEIDKQKLLKLLNDRGLSMSDASRAIGLSACYISHCASDGRISKSSAKSLSLAFGIEIEDYIAKNEPEVEEEPEPEGECKPVSGFEMTEDFEKRLYKVIYSAVYEAVRKAWNEPINIEKEG